MFHIKSATGYALDVPRQSSWSAKGLNGRPLNVTEDDLDCLIKSIGMAMTEF